MTDPEKAIREALPVVAWGPAYKQDDKQWEPLVRLSDAESHLAALRSEVERLKALLPAPPEPAKPAFWFMRDNHTFKRLSGTPEEMVEQCLAEFDAGWTSGSLFGRDVQPGFGVHAKGSARREDFKAEALAAFAALGKEQAP